MIYDVVAPGMKSTNDAISSNYGSYNYNIPYRNCLCLSHKDILELLIMTGT